MVERAGGGQGGGLDVSCEAAVGRWYSMWQTHATHATFTYHAAHFPDAALPSAVPAPLCVPA